MVTTNQTNDQTNNQVIQVQALTSEKAVFCNNRSMTRATHPASSSIDPSLSGIVNDNPGVDSISLEYTRNVEEQRKGQSCYSNDPDDRKQQPFMYWK